MSSSTHSSSNSHSFAVKPLNLSPVSPSITRKSRPPSINVSGKPSHISRRQSSISYIVSPPSTSASTITSGPQTCSAEWLEGTRVDDVVTPPSRLLRSVSLGSRNVLKGEIRKGSRSSQNGLNIANAEDSGPNRRKQPLTPVEKHAELLHVIAQKESLCLELRSQLAVHEAELLQLKRKWEVIVSRGLDVPLPMNLDHTYSTPSASSQNSSTAIVLEGIKEGVQGVGRLILGQPTSSPSPSISSPKVRPRNDRNRYSIASDPSLARLSQSSSVSTSSNTSSATSSITTSTKRTSISSSGSGGEVTGTFEGEGEGEFSVVMQIQDTGASPIMSPGPVFKPLLRQVEEHAAEQDGVSIDSADFERTFFASSSPSISSKTLRRRSGGLVSSSITSSPLVSSHLDDSSAETSTSPKTPRGDDIAAQSAAKTNKTTSLPPSSIPGLGSFAAGVGISSVGTLGKKWEEGLAKSQKRASTLLSDIVSVLSPPITSSSPSSSSSTFTSSPASLTPSTLSTSFPPAPKLTPSLKSKSSSKASHSLLDDSDDDTISSNFLNASVMVPDQPKPYPVMTPMPNPAPPRSSSTLTRSASGKYNAKPTRGTSNSNNDLMDDDEWNW